LKSKAIENIVASQLNHHLNRNNLNVTLQSAYKSQHSVESALLKIFDDLLTAIDNNKSVFLVLLDLLAAFDTVDHQILLDRLYKKFGIRDIALKWFKSYLSERQFRVDMDGTLCNSYSLKCGVPQGSILGPILFSY